MEITPAATSSKNDFDFYVGKWNIQDKKLKTRLNGCTEWVAFPATDMDIKALDGLGNLNFYKSVIDGVAFEGLTVRLFNPKTKLWSIYWADSNVGVLDTPVSGSFKNKIGRFFTNAIYEGKSILVQFHWDATNPEKPVWSQAFSEDDGQNWEWNWHMYATRTEKR